MNDEEKLYQEKLEQGYRAGLTLARNIRNLLAYLDLHGECPPHEFIKKTDNIIEGYTSNLLDIEEEYTNKYRKLKQLRYNEINETAAEGETQG